MLRYLEVRSEVSSGMSMSLEVTRSVQRYLETRSEVCSGM